jgi:HEAT repeat protein
LTHNCRTIIKAGHAGDRETVLAGLEHEAPEGRVAALGAAARLGILDPATLARFFDDPADRVRYRAVELAARSGEAGVELSDRLVAALDDDPLAEVAAFALGELPLTGPRKDRAVAALGRQAIGHDDPLCRESAVAALGALGAGLEHILAATSDIATVRRRAVLALAPFAGPEVDEALTRALHDRDWQVRQAAEDLRPEPEQGDGGPR